MIKYLINSEPCREREFFKILKSKAKHSTSNIEECFEDLIQTHCCSFVSENQSYEFQILMKEGK